MHIRVFSYSVLNFFLKKDFVQRSKFGKILKGISGTARFDVEKLEKIIKKLIMSIFKTLDEDTVLKKKIMLKATHVVERKNKGNFFVLE